MLVLSRKSEERIIIGDEIEITVLAIHGNRVCLGIRAPAEVPILRDELDRRMREDQRSRDAFEAA